MHYNKYRKDSSVDYTVDPSSLASPGANWALSLPYTRDIQIETAV